MFIKVLLSRELLSGVVLTKLTFRQYICLERKIIVTWNQFRKAMNVLSIPRQIKYFKIGSRIVKVVIPLHPHVNIIQDLISDEHPLFTGFWLCSGTWKLSPLCLFLCVSVLKPVYHYYHGVNVFIELEIKTSPGDKMSVSFVLAHIYQFSVIEPRPSVEFRDCKMAGIDVLMSTRTHARTHGATDSLGLNIIMWELIEIPPSFTGTYIYIWICILLNTSIFESDVRLTGKCVVISQIHCTSWLLWL